MKFSKSSYLLLIAAVGVFSIGIAYATTSFDSVKLGNTGSMFWSDNGTSLSKTGADGSSSGNFLNERGYSGILFRVSGTSSYGTGTEEARIDRSGLVMARNQSYSWSDLGISLSRTDSSGSIFGNYLNERGFDGILFRTGGTTSYGTGNEQMRISNPSGFIGMGIANPQQKLDVSGNIQLTGNLRSNATAGTTFKITAPAGVPICIGTGC